MEMKHIVQTRFTEGRVEQLLAEPSVSRQVELTRLAAE